MFTLAITESPKLQLSENVLPLNLANDNSCISTLFFWKSDASLCLKCSPLQRCCTAHTVLHSCVFQCLHLQAFTTHSCIYLIHTTWTHEEWLTTHTGPLTVHMCKSGRKKQLGDFKPYGGVCWNKKVSAIQNDRLIWYVNHPRNLSAPIAEH